MSLTHVPLQDGDDKIIQHLFQITNIGAPLKGVMAICDLFRKPWIDILSSSVYPPLTPKDECKRASFGNFELAILRGPAFSIPFHGSGDLAILRDLQADRYVVMLGERQKNNFSRGVIAFNLARESAPADIQSLFSSWRTEFDAVAKKAGWKATEDKFVDYGEEGDNSWYDVRDELSKIFAVTDVDEYRPLLKNTPFNCNSTQKGARL